MLFENTLIEIEDQLKKYQWEYDNVIFDSSLNLDERVKKQHLLGDIISKLKLKKAELIDERNQKQQFNDTVNNKSVLINQDKQHITIWNHTYPNFEALFKNIKLKYTKTQLKWWITLIYAITINDMKHKMLVSDLLDLCYEFRNNWKNWIFENKWNKKNSITKNDCDSANSILDSCGISIKLKLSKDKKEIIID